MGDQTIPGFSLTPDEEKFFVGFLRRRALPWSVAISALAGALTAGALTCTFLPSSHSAPPEDVAAEESGMPAAPLADDKARAELASLRAEFEAVRAQRLAPASPGDVPAVDDARVAELRRSLDGLKRELQTIATSVTELQNRAGSESTPASPDAAAPADVEPLRKRVINVEARQDREETARLEWAGNVEQRVRNLEVARRERDAEAQAALQGLQDRLQRVEQSLGPPR